MTTRTQHRARLVCFAWFAVSTLAAAAGWEQAANTWMKLSPLENTPPSPRMGYEGACAWDGKHGVWIRYGGHNQGGGGEQNSELWVFTPETAKWTLKESNQAPPGVCCEQQNVFDPTWGRFVRFPSFSGSHGWQWWREIYLNDSTVWTYDLEANLWCNLRPVPAPRVSPLRCASWDSGAQVVVMFGGEGNREGTRVYDPYTNTWTRMKPPAEPDSRSGGNMVYDSARKVHILFGAQFTDDPHTWAYDLRRNEWRDLQPPAMPHTNQNDAVLAYDSYNRVVVALVKITEGEGENARHRLETWTFDAGRNRWTKRNPPQEPDASGNRARVMGFAPELGLTVLENCTHARNGGSREQQIWTYCYAPPSVGAIHPPQPPSSLRVATRSDGVTLTWTPSPSKGVTGYNIYRGTGNQPWLVNFDKVDTVSADQTTYRDTGLKRATVYEYSIRATFGTRESAETVRARTQPRIVDRAVVSVRNAKQVELTWTPPGGDDIAGYFVERARVEVWTEDQLRRLKSRTPPLEEPSVGAVRRIGPFVRLHGDPVRGTAFVDSVDLAAPRPVEGDPLFERDLYPDHLDTNGKSYRFAVFAYRIRAINALGVESGPSPYFLTIPSAPQWPYAKEEGPTCRLKWAENPEKNLKGYRVYRLDGRWDKDTLSRLTPEPIAETTFADETAGTKTRRYHIVAVDALGQEGMPSRPVWFSREWKRYYEPFVGEWHQ